MADNPFWVTLDRFGEAPALFDAAGRAISYRELVRDAVALAGVIGSVARLVFLEIDNTPAALIAYLACLIGRHPVFVYGRDDRDKIAALIETYRPNLIIGARGELDWHTRTPLPLHPDLAVLLSTSGSTGSAKLVKLSARNIDANARSIAEYLALGPSERAITLLKPYYSYGLSVVHSHWLCGGALILSDAAVSETAFWQTFRSCSATSFAGVPYTFETLARIAITFDDFPSFRYCTQAGGRLAPSLVRQFARVAAAAGGRFYVMYGQTEAAPRMTYLPPEFAERYPDSIGVPIPRGAITLVDEGGAAVTETGKPGEIVYRGPNVMMGYARGPDDLARDDTPEALRTGDIAARNEAGLLVVVGRAARFVKLFGKRLNLDEVEARLRTAGRTAVVAGDDTEIVVALEDGGDDPAPALAASFDLPPFAIRARRVAAIPRLPSGKPDYQAILSRRSGPPLPTRILSWDFVTQVGREAATILGLAPPRWQSVADIFHQLVGPAAPGDSFASLNGDSMRFVQVSLALEEFLGDLPPAWEKKTISELERMRDGIL